MGALLFLVSIMLVAEMVITGKEFRELRADMRILRERVRKVERGA